VSSRAAEVAEMDARLRDQRFTLEANEREAVRAGGGGGQG
jgi:hypothetical protein